MTSKRYTAVAWTRCVTAAQIGIAMREYGVEIKPDSVLTDVSRGDVYDTESKTRVESGVDWPKAVACAGDLNKKLRLADGN